MFPKAARSAAALCGGLGGEAPQTRSASSRSAQRYGTMTEGPWLDPATMFDDIYVETPPHLEVQRQQMLALED